MSVLRQELDHEGPGGLGQGSPFIGRGAVLHSLPGTTELCLSAWHNCERCPLALCKCPGLIVKGFFILLMGTEPHCRMLPSERQGEISGWGGWWGREHDWRPDEWY